MEKFTVSQNNEVVGKFTLEEINNKLISGDFRAGDLGWRKGMDGWLPLRKIEGVIASLRDPKEPPVDEGRDAQTDFSEPIQEASKTPVRKGPLYAIVERFWDGVMSKLDGLLSEKVFNRVSKAMTITGFYALPIGAVLCFLGGLFAAIKTDSLADLMVLGIGYAVLISVLNYSALKMLPALDKLITNTETKMGTPAFLNSISVVFFIGGVGMFLGGLFGAIKGETMLPLIMGGVFLFFGVQWVIFCRNPKLLNIEIDESINLGEEFLGLMAFFFKSFLKALPIYFGLMVVLTVLGQLFGLLSMLGGGLGAVAGLFYFQASSSSLAGVAALPLLGYLMFLGYYMVVEVLRAILSLLHIRKSLEK